MWSPNGAKIEWLFICTADWLHEVRLCMYNHKREAAIYRLLCWISDESLQEELKALRHCQPNCYCCGCLMELRLQNYFIGELWDIWDIYLKKKSLQQITYTVHCSWILFLHVRAIGYWHLHAPTEEKPGNFQLLVSVQCPLTSTPLLFIITGGGGHYIRCSSPKIPPRIKCIIT